MTISLLFAPPHSTQNTATTTRRALSLYYTFAAYSSAVTPSHHHILDDHPRPSDIHIYQTSPASPRLAICSTNCRPSSVDSCQTPKHPNHVEHSTQTLQVAHELAPRSHDSTRSPPRQVTACAGHHATNLNVRSCGHHTTTFPRFMDLSNVKSGPGLALGWAYKILSSEQRQSHTVCRAAGPSIVGVVFEWSTLSWTTWWRAALHRCSILLIGDRRDWYF